MHACAEMLLGDPRDLQSLKMELLLTLLLFSIPSKTDLIATPQYSSQRSDLFGSCGHLEISQLGSFGEPSISGLVPSNLQHSAQERSQGDPLYTMDYPLVRINSAVITCESRSTMRIGYGTVSVIVEFTCRGVACQQFQVRNRTYSHLFSFVCRPGGAIYETQMSIDGFRASINRDTTNSVSNTVTASDDSCMLCTNDISVQTDSRFQQETGCLGMLLTHLYVHNCLFNWLVAGQTLYPMSRREGYGETPIVNWFCLVSNYFFNHCNDVTNWGITCSTTSSCSLPLLQKPGISAIALSTSPELELSGAACTDSIDYFVCALSLLNQLTMETLSSHSSGKGLTNSWCIIL